MTALTDLRPASTLATHRPTAGLGALVRKDVTEWFRGRRAWVVALAVTLFMVPTAANAVITAWIIEQLPAGADAPDAPLSMAPLDNLGAAIGAQMFLLAAIFAVASLLPRERESGTLAWVATKPVSRGAIWIAKWSSATAMLVLFGVLIPFAVTIAFVVGLYGIPDPASVALVTVGAMALVTFFAAVGLGAATVVPGTVPVVAIGFAVFALTPIVGAIVPALIPFLPMSILEWTVGLASGAPVGIVTPIAWLVGTGALVAGSVWRMGRLEL